MSSGRNSLRGFSKAQPGLRKIALVRRIGVKPVLFRHDPGSSRSSDDFQLARLPRRPSRSAFPRLSAAAGGGQTRKSGSRGRGGAWFLADQSSLHRGKPGGGGTKQELTQAQAIAGASPQPDPLRWPEQTRTFALRRRAVLRIAVDRPQRKQFGFHMLRFEQGLHLLHDLGMRRGDVGRFGAVFGQVVQLDLAGRWFCFGRGAC